MLEAVSPPGWHTHAGMQIEALVARVARPQPRHHDLRGPEATAADLRAGPGTKRHASLHRRRREPGQHRRLIGPLIQGVVPIVHVVEPAAGEQAAHVRCDGRKHLVDVRRVELRVGMKAQTCGVHREHAVNDQRMKMNVQIQRPPNRCTMATAPLRPSTIPATRACRRRKPRTARMNARTTARHRS